MNAKKLLKSAIAYCDQMIKKNMPYQVLDKESPP